MYRLPPATASHTRSFLSKNEEDPQSKTLIFDGFVALSPQSTVLMGWPGAILAKEDLARLDELLAVLNYLGRSESWIEARLVAAIRRWLGTVFPTGMPAKRAAWKSCR